MASIASASAAAAATAAAVSPDSDHLVSGNAAHAWCEAGRTFGVPECLAKGSSHIASMAQYAALYEESIAKPQQFWSRMARDNLTWFRDFTEVYVVPCAPASRSARG